MTDAIFVDTSALYPCLLPKDKEHRRALRSFEHLQASAAPLLTTSFVLAELCGLLGRRIGLAAIKTFRSDIAPLLDVVWVDEPLHEAGMDLLLERDLRHLSLVDAVSFVAMRRRGIERAFAFDSDFEREGFSLVD